MQKVIFPLLTSLILALLIFRPLLNLSWYPMNDSTHISRILLLDATIRGGQFPPIWAHGINSGLGYPLFHFYAPLFHLTATLLAQVTSALLALKLTLFFTTVLGIFGIMQLTKGWGKGAMLIGGIAWGLSPYGALDLYVRGAFSEYLALALLPWVLWVFRPLSSIPRAIGSGLIFSLFILSHNLIPLLTMPLILAWGLSQNRHQLKLFLLTLLLTLGFSAWFLGPLIFERHFTHADTIARTTDYALHFVSPWQIWNSTWGFGGSAAGVEDGISFKLGKIQLILASLGLLSALLLRHRRVVLLGIFALFFLFLSTASSSYLWETLPFLSLMQFPWRALGPAAVLMAVLTAYLTSLLRPPGIRLGYTLLVVGSLLYFNLKYFRPQTLIDAPIRIDDIARVVPEYLPVWLNGFPNATADPLARAYYPTWTVKVEGQLVPTHANELGLLAYPNLLGSPNVELIQSHTPLEKISYSITILSFLLVLLYLRFYYV